MYLQSHNSMSLLSILHSVTSIVHATTCYLTVLRADSLLLVCVDVCKGRLDKEVQ